MKTALNLSFCAVAADSEHDRLTLNQVVQFSVSDSISEIATRTVSMLTSIRPEAYQYQDQQPPVSERPATEVSKALL